MSYMDGPQGVPDRLPPQRGGHGRRQDVVRLQQAPQAHEGEPRAPGTLFSYVVIFGNVGSFTYRDTL